jgi:alpha-2-macroglobulin
MVVDEAVLSLMGFSTPDPVDFFHRPREGGVGLHALQANVMPRQRPDATDDSKDAAPESFDEGAMMPGSGVGTGYGYGRGSKEEQKRSSTPRPRMAAPAAPAAEPKPQPDMKAAETLDAAQAMAQPVSLRTLFATTAHFDADVRTDEQGRVRLSIPMPENLTTFRVMAVAVDPDQADRFGHGETTVRVRKPIMVRPSLPRFASYGDRFEGSVMVDNQTGQAQAVLVGTRGLNVTHHGATQSTIHIPAGESREVRFDLEVARVGNMRLQFAAMSNAGRDATEVSLPVHFPATTKAFADYGMTDASIQRTVEPPSDALPDFGGLQLSLSSTALSGLEDAVRYLVDYPYECTEQTASRILPIFALSKILDDFPVAEVRDRKRRDALVATGIERLLSAQNHDGGFGLWTPRESWPHLTNWVTFALLEGKRAGHDVDEAALTRALAFVDRFVRHGHRTRWGNYYDWTSRAFGLWLLSGEGRGSESFDSIWTHRKEMPLFARAMLMGAAHRYGKTSARDEILAELRHAVVESARAVHFAESRSEAASDGLRLLMHSNVQTDAIVLANLLEVAPSDPMLSKIIAGIMAERGPERGGRWRSTHANAWALVAASRYYETVESEEPDYLARVWLDARFAGEHTFMGRSMATVEQLVPMAALLGAEQRELTLHKKGTGKLYYRLGLRYAPADLKLDAVDNGFTVYRTYEALGSGDIPPDPEAVKQLDDGSWQVKAGTNVKVTIHLVARDRANYVVIDDPLPAGFEGQNPRFVTSVGVNPADTGPTTTVDRGRGTQRWWWPWFRFDHTQMRDDRMLLFADHLPAGVYTYAYTAAATTRGHFALPPVKAEAMYEPEIFGHGSSSRVRIVD